MSSAAGQVVWTPCAVDLPSPRLRFRSTDNVVFHVHDNALFPQSLALQALLGDYSIDEQPSTILPLNISSDALKLILHFVYNAEFPREGWLYTGPHGVSLQTIHNAVSGCQQYMMYTVASSLEAPLRANMKTDPLLAAIIAHIPVISNMALCDDALRLAANTPATFLGSQASRRALLPASAIDLLYQYREDLQLVIRRQETAQAAGILANFQIDDLNWNEDEGAIGNSVSHLQTCRHWPVVANTLKVKLHEMLLDLLREKAGLKKLLEVEGDIGCSTRTSCRGCRKILTQNLRRLASELARVVH
ncbi:hypothetical protein FRC14_002631 [Serendipita sp. 396]|nr:hypothetical protein FRC14_002631 [Serendipita sp. 396]KAG8783079.1 hypothetical protein FRC15_005825 [Serendipita sp. 397]KAG8868324.1 hypothetical protein FRC20_003606 [Serendipita sp. 405]